MAVEKPEKLWEFSFSYFVATLLKCLKAGKVSGLHNLCKENVRYAHPIIITHLTNLFNMILMHGFVPDKFRLGVTVPVVKDEMGNYKTNCFESSYI